MFRCLPCMYWYNLAVCKSSFEFDELADDRRRRDTIDEKGYDSKSPIDASIW